MQIDEEIIISLIKDDLINTKLVNGLTDLGLDAGCYLLGLNTLIFHLMGFKSDMNSDKLYEAYLQQAQRRVRDLDISYSNAPLETPAREMYKWLVKRREKEA